MDLPQTGVQTCVCTTPTKTWPSGVHAHMRTCAHECTHAHAHAHAHAHTPTSWYYCPLHNRRITTGGTIESYLRESFPAEVQYDWKPCTLGFEAVYLEIKADLNTCSPDRQWEFPAGAPESAQWAPSLHLLRTHVNGKDAPQKPLIGVGSLKANLPILIDANSNSYIGEAHYAPLDKVLAARGGDPPL